MKKIVITFNANEEHKKLINSIFSDTAQIEFIRDYDRKEFDAVLKDADILFAWNPPRELRNIKKDSLRNIEFVQLLSAGFDHIDFSRFPDNCKIASNKGAYAAPMAEHIIAMILFIYKNLLENHKKLAAGEFNQKSVSRYLKDSTCGILGYGGIGRATANLFKAFDTRIFALNTSAKTGDEIEFIGTLQDINYVLTYSDIIVISLPLNKETDGLINKTKLESMKPDAVLINVARGEIIVEKDLYEHLKTHPDFYAGIDAWWVEPFTSGEFRINFPFFDLPNFLGSPHNSAIVPGIILSGIQKASANILDFLNGKEIETVK
ncbi:MAG: 2-hydroxyacid dehydrogenase [Ignavibacteriaceae bacterium]